MAASQSLGQLGYRRNPERWANSEVEGPTIREFYINMLSAIRYTPTDMHEICDKHEINATEN